MTDDNMPQGLTDEEKAAVKSYLNVGTPGPAPTTPYVPTEEQRQKFLPMSMPRSISVEWTYDQKGYDQLQLGHLAQAQEDKWNIYMEDNTVHFHHSWIGGEIYRFTLQPADNGLYTVSNFEVEQDPERNTETDEQAIKDNLYEVLWGVVGGNLITPSRQ